MEDEPDAARMVAKGLREETYAVDARPQPHFMQGSCCGIIASGIPQALKERHL